MFRTKTIIVCAEKKLIMESRKQLGRLCQTRNWFHFDASFFFLKVQFELETSIWTNLNWNQYSLNCNKFFSSENFKPLN